MKILFLSTEYPPETGGGGIGSYVASMAPALASRGHEVHVLSCAPGLAHRNYIEKGVYIHRRDLKVIPGITKIGRVLRLTRTIRHIHIGLSTFLAYRRLGVQFDVIEHPDWSAEGWLFALLHNRPLVAHLHTPLPIILKYNKLPITFDARIASAIEHFSMKKSEVVTSPSKYLVNKLNEIGWLRDTDVDVISYPVDLPKWSRTLPVSEAPPTVLFIGRLEALKAPELLAQAMTIIRKEIPEAGALFVGKSKGERDGLPYLEWIKKIAGDDHSCEFVGQVHRNALPGVFSRCRVLAIPSWHDNYPMVALESMAAGRAVVVTQSTGIVELLKISDAGKIVPPGDLKSLAQALSPFLTDSSYAEKMGKRARKTAIKMLDPARLAARREKAYWNAIDIYNRGLRAKVSGFRHALPEKVASFRIPRKWRDWAVSETTKTPWKHFYLPTARHFLELLGHAPSLNHSTDLEQIRVLDVGCTPAVSVLLACLGAEVTILDTDLSELQKGKEYADLLGVTGKVRCVCADAFKIPFSARTFDVVWNSGFLEHFTNPKKLLFQMRYVLRQEGLLVVLVPNRWTPHSLWIRDRLRAKLGGYKWDNMGRERSYTQRQLICLLWDAGFQVIASSTSNLRRSLLDDSWVLSHMTYLALRGFLFRLMNSIDCIENRFPSLRNFGFMVGAAATQLPKANKRVLLS